MALHSPQQIFMQLKWAELDRMAASAGFSKVALEEAEFGLALFFDRVVEHCATIAEQQGRVYSGENNEMAGCQAVANAIRNYGKTLGR